MRGKLLYNYLKENNLKSAQVVVNELSGSLNIPGELLQICDEKGQVEIHLFFDNKSTYKKFLTILNGLLKVISNQPPDNQKSFIPLLTSLLYLFVLHDNIILATNICTILNTILTTFQNTASTITDELDNCRGTEKNPCCIYLYLLKNLQNKSAYCRKSSP